MILLYIVYHRFEIIYDLGSVVVCCIYTTSNLGVYMDISSVTIHRIGDDASIVTTLVDGDIIDGAPYDAVYDEDVVRFFMAFGQRHEVRLTIRPATTFVGWTPCHAKIA